MKKIVFSAFALLLMLSVSPVSAGVDRSLVINTKSKAGVGLAIPDHAIEVAPDVFYLGTSVDADGTLLEGYAIVDRANKAKPSGTPGGGKDKNTTTSTCYAPLAKGAKWKSVEPYRFDASLSSGLSTSTLQFLIATSTDKWNIAAGTEIFGNEEGGVVDLASIGNSTNGNNEVAFASLNSNSTIAVTYTWGVFAGSPGNRYLAEWDMILNTDFDWSAEEAGVAGKMDFENIATHEIGHAAGLGHPSDTCIDETMYRYASDGETKKRDLNSGDIAGILDLYK